MGTVEQLISHWCEGAGEVEDRLAVAASIAAMDRCTNELELQVLGRRLAREADLSEVDRTALRTVYAQYQRVVKMRYLRARPAVPLRRMGGEGKSGASEWVREILNQCKPSSSPVSKVS